MLESEFQIGNSGSIEQIFVSFIKQCRQSFELLKPCRGAGADLRHDLPQFSSIARSKPTAFQAVSFEHRFSSVVRLSRSGWEGRVDWTTR